MKDNILIIIKGLIIGSTMTVPGISGGSMALLLGIYDKLISAVGNIFKEPKKSIIFLVKFSIPSLIGIVVFSQMIAYLLNEYNVGVRYFFLGIIAGGIPIILKNSNIRKFNWDCIFYPLIGIIFVYIISMLPNNSFGNHSGTSFIFLQIISGFLLAFALILPGVSISQMLLMLGLYQPLIQIVKDREIYKLLPISLSFILFSFIIALILKKLLDEYCRETYLVVIGFLLGSIFDLFPAEAVPSLLYIVIALLGCLIMLLVTRLAN